MTDNRIDIKPMQRLFAVMICGSWGVLLTVPLTIFIAAGEVHGRQWWITVPFVATGYALIYFAVRAAIVRIRLRIDADALIYEHVPWPRRAKRWRLGQISSARATIRPVTFWEPETIRGFVVPRASTVWLTVIDREIKLPLYVSEADAQRIRALIAHQCTLRSWALKS